MRDFLLDTLHIIVSGSHYCAQDRIAMRIVARYGMTKDCKMARRHNMQPQEAL